MTTAATLVLALAACGGGDDGDDSDDSERGDGGTPAEPVQFRRVLEQTTDACPDPAVQPDPAAEAIACDDEGTAHRLAPAEIVGGVDDAEAAMSPDGGGWTVAVELDDEATTTFEAITRELVGTQQQVAIVTGGRIVTAPVIQSAITDGKVQIAGDLDRDEAEALADALEGAEG
jgi:preprotein translocase subunit SecD